MCGMYIGKPGARNSFPHFPTITFRGAGSLETSICTRAQQTPNASSTQHEWRYEGVVSEGPDRME